MMTNTITQLTHSDIKKIYTSGFKTKNTLKVGLEYERLPIKCEDNCAAEYWGESGICEFLRSFAKYENWDYITDNYEIIGLKQGHDTITLEPGCQLEFSLEPQLNITELEKNVRVLDSLIQPFLADKGIRLLNYGVSPCSTHKNIKLIPKKRYEIMAKYLWGILSDVMMRETAGVQGTFDFTDEEDAMRKFKIANMISPFVTAMFANSPIRGGADTGYKSFRALSWLNTDNDRCGYFYNFCEDFSFDDYINMVLKTPMLFINRDSDYSILSGKIDFAEYMANGYDGHYADIEDYLLQANLCFPEVRLRNFIEVRNQDCCGEKLPYAMLALYKGILYSPTAMRDVETLLSGVSSDDYTELRYNVPRHALQTPFNGKNVAQYAKELVNIAENGLKESFSEEVLYLDFIKEYISEEICPADVIIRNWYGSWDKNPARLIDYVSAKF